jgi:hypothetical protein
MEFSEYILLGQDFSLKQVHYGVWRGYTREPPNIPPNLPPLQVGVPGLGPVYDAKDVGSLADYGARALGRLILHQPRVLVE